MSYTPEALNGTVPPTIAPGSTPRTDEIERIYWLNPGDTSEIWPKVRKLETDLYDCRRTCAELVTDGNAVTLAESLQRVSADLAALRSRCAALEQDRERLDWLQSAILREDPAQQFFRIGDGPMIDQITLTMYNGSTTKQHTGKELRAILDAARQAAPHAGAGEGRG